MSASIKIADGYAQALCTLSEHSPNKTKQYMDNILLHLEKTGRMKLLPHIYRAVLVCEKRKKDTQPVIEIANEDERAAALRAAAKLELETRHVVIAPDLLSGWRIRAKNTLIDSSAKGNLLRLYYHLITMY